jgi:hypothetical protein
LPRCCRSRRARAGARHAGETGPTRFIYTPDPGFKGKDAYLFKICATKGAQKGCSTVAFVVQVK